MSWLCFKGVLMGRPAQLPEVSQQQELHVGVQPHAGQVRPERHVQLRDLLHHQPVQLLCAARARTCAPSGRPSAPQARFCSSPAQYCGLRLRRHEEEHEVLRRWCEALGQKYRGQRLAGLAQKLLKAKREVPGAAERQKTLAGRQVRAVRLRANSAHLQVGPRGAGETGLCGQRADFAGAVWRLPQQKSAQPTSLESRVAPGVMEYARL